MASNFRSFVLLWFLLPIMGGALLAADHNVSIAGVATGSGNGQWKWTVFLKGSAEAIGHLRCVQYMLGAGFPDPSRTVCERGSPDQPFSTGGVTWGSFGLSATVVFDDKTTAQLKYNLNPQAVAQATDLISGRWQFVRQGSSGTGATYRTYRRIGDSLDVFIEGQTHYVLVCDGQVHRTTEGQDISCTFNGGTGFQGHQQPPSSYFVDEVTGNTLTITTWSDAAHSRKTLTLIYNRVAPTP